MVGSSPHSNFNLCRCMLEPTLILGKIQKYGQYFAYLTSIVNKVIFIDTAFPGFEFVSDDTPLMDEIDASEDIQSWQDQYGQVVRTNVKTESSLGAINLWYWTICIQKITNMNRDSICLVGQLAANKSTLHPSLQHRNGIIKTSQICEVNLDLVKVSSGADVFIKRESTTQNTFK